MNSTYPQALIAALSLSLGGTSFAQSTGMGDMSTKAKGTSIDQLHPTTKATTMTHQADAVVKNVDAAQGKVTLAHDPIKSLGWPAMTMGFVVKDKALFDKLTVGKKVHVQLEKEAADYVVTSVR